MPGRCAAVSCNNRLVGQSESERKLSFHRFPLKNPVLLKQWLINMRRKGCWRNTTYTVLWAFRGWLLRVVLAWAHSANRCTSCCCPHARPPGRLLHPYHCHCCFQRSVVYRPHTPAQTDMASAENRQRSQQFQLHLHPSLFTNRCPEMTSHCKYLVVATFGRQEHWRQEWQQPWLKKLTN